MSGICAQLPFRSRARKTASDDALLDCGHRVAGQAGEGSGPSFEGKRLGRASAVLQGVPVVVSSAAGAVHPTDVMSPNGRRAAPEPGPRMTLATPPPTAMRSVRSSNTIRPRPNRTRTGIQPNHGRAGDSMGFRRSTMGWRHAAGTFKAAESEPVNLLSIMRR
jgi:hypothetical protein